MRPSPRGIAPEEGSVTLLDGLGDDGYFNLDRLPGDAGALLAPNGDICYRSVTDWMELNPSMSGSHRLPDGRVVGGALRRESGIRKSRLPRPHDEKFVFPYRGTRTKFAFWGQRGSRALDYHRDEPEPARALGPIAQI